MTAMYAMVFVVPADPATLALGPRATPELKEAPRARMGLDQPFLSQLMYFFGKVLQGDLGIDVWSKRPVLDQILEVFPKTLILGVTALGSALALGTGLGRAAVVWRDTLADRLLGCFRSASSASLPS